MNCRLALLFLLLAAPAKTQSLQQATLEEEVNFNEDGEVLDSNSPASEQEKGLEEEATFEEDVVFGDEPLLAGERPSLVNAGFPEHDDQAWLVLLPVALLGLAALNTRWRKNR